MSLVPCPECKAMVSRAAASCPQCGFPFGGATVLSAAAQGAAAAAPGAEQVLWEGSPSLKALSLTTIATGVFAIALPIAVYLAYEPLRDLIAHSSVDTAALVAEHEDQARTVIVLAVVVAILSRVARLAWRMLALRGNRYTISNQRIRVESGVFSKSLAEVDVRTIDDITFRQSLVERLSGVGEIAIRSSDPTNPQLRLIGVPGPREVRELIRNSAYQATRGQLFTRST